VWGTEDERGSTDGGNGESLGALRTIRTVVLPTPPTGDDWLGLTSEPLDEVGDVYAWCVRPGCGAVVLFSGTVRDHAEGRQGVTHLVYEAYAEQVMPRMGELAAEMRRRYPGVGRLAVLHRVGPIELERSSVLVAVSAPHRQEAFEAARFGIDTLKETLPIWKQEHHGGGADWGTGSHEIRSAADVGATEGVAGARGDDSPSGPG